MIVVVEKGCGSTQSKGDTLRQCAWCLRLIDKAGKCISVSPSPKLYKATHGMCRICALGWMEQVAEAHGVQAGSLWDAHSALLVGSGTAP